VSPRSLPPWKRVLFALLALIACLAGIEGILQVRGGPPPADRTSTWFADQILHPPLVHHERVFRPRLHYLRPGQASQFHPFAAERPDRSLRVAVLGGSAAHGYGVLEPGAFPHHIEQLLQEAVPGSEVQVINFGTIAWSSQQLLWAARQLWDLSDWDLLIIYSGHNELLELSSWKTYMEPSAHRRFTRALLWNQRLESLRLFQWLRSLLAGGSADETAAALKEGQRDSAATPVGPSNLVVGIDPVADVPAHHLNELQALPVSERARMGEFEWQYAAQTYAHNVGKIIELARDRGTPVLLVSPAPNDLQDPISFSPAGVAGERLEERLAQARARMDESDLQGMARLARALVEESGDSRAMYLLAQALHHQGDHAQARHWYTEARAHTEYPSRIVPAVHDAVLGLAGEDGVLAVVDMEAHFRDAAPGGVIGYELVYDHCHPSVEGHLLIAAKLVEQLFEAGFAGLSGVEHPDVDAWLQVELTRLRSSTTSGPQLWQWDGRSEKGGQAIYLSGVPGGFKGLRAAQEERVANSTASAEDWLWAGNGRFYSYEIEDALLAWKRSLALDPQLCVAWANRAYGLRLAGGRDAALRAARKAVACSPENREYAQSLALLERLVGR
jgi:tetratricopeptide (TPR) repeat protein